jgi:hypothetical protein
MQKKKLSWLSFIFSVLVAIGFILLIIYRVGFFSKKERAIIEKNEVIVNGCITKRFHCKMLCVSVTYAYNGQQYEIETVAPRKDIMTGSCFRVHLNRSNPSQSFVAYDEPVWENHQKITWTQGVINVVSTKNTIGFIYQVGNKSQKGIQQVKATEGLKIGQQYKVAYVTDTSSIAIMHLDSFLTQ